MNEKFLRWISGVDNLKIVFYGRLISGLLFAIYGFLVFYFISIKDIWMKWSILLAFLGIGVTFLLDGQTILREYFNRGYIQYSRGKQIMLINLAEFIFIIGSILVLIKFYNSSNASFYPLIIFLIIIFAIIIFHKRISNFKINLGENSIEVLINQKEGIEKREEIWKVKYGSIKFIPKGKEVK